MHLRQRICPEQFGELSDEQKINLRNWYYPNKVRLLDQYIYFNKGELCKTAYYGDYFLDNKPSELFNHFNECETLPLLTIGQMIEFISEFSSTLIITRHEAKDGIIWNPKITLIGTTDQTYESSNVELCDALWEITKHILGDDKHVYENHNQ